LFNRTIVIAVSKYGVYEYSINLNVTFDTDVVTVRWHCGIDVLEVPRVS